MGCARGRFRGCAGTPLAHFWNTPGTLLMIMMIMITTTAVMATMAATTAMAVVATMTTMAVVTVMTTMAIMNTSGTPLEHLWRTFGTSPLGTIGLRVWQDGDMDGPRSRPQGCGQPTARPRQAHCEIIASPRQVHEDQGLKSAGPRMVPKCSRECSRPWNNPWNTPFY